MQNNNLDLIIQKNHDAGKAILNGDPGIYKSIYSDQEDITLGNPFGPYAKGKKDVYATLDKAASVYKDGIYDGADIIAQYISNDIACTVEVERGRAKIEGSEDMHPIAIRVTNIFRMEQGAWKLVHRHADPIINVRPPSSVISK